MLLAAGEKALPSILEQRADWLLREGQGELEIAGGAIQWDNRALARVELLVDFGAPRIVLARELSALPEAARKRLEAGLLAWLGERLEPLEPLRTLAEATRDPAAGSEARALLHTLIAGHGVVSRENAGLEHLPKELRPYLRKLGVQFGALDIYAHALLKPAPRQLLHALGLDRRELQPAMLPVIAGGRRLPAGYRPAGTQAIRVDLAEKILRAAFDARAKAGGDWNQRFAVDPALGISIGLEQSNLLRLLGASGFHCHHAKPLPEGAFGPPAPDRWTWRPRRTDSRTTPHREGKHRDRKKVGKEKGRHRQTPPAAHRPEAGPARSGGAFDGLADLLKADRLV